MPQPESCSSDWRMRGFSASTSSCRIEAGSADTQPNTRHMTAHTLPGREIAGGRLGGHGTEHVSAPPILVGAPAKAVRAGAAGRRGEVPPPRPAGGGDLVPALARRMDGRERDAHPAQHRRVRGGGASVAPRAGAERRRGGRAAGGAAASLEARSAPPRSGGDPRGPPHGLRGGGLRGASARGEGDRPGGGAGIRGASRPGGHAGGVRARGGGAEEVEALRRGGGGGGLLRRARAPRGRGG